MSNQPNILWICTDQQRFDTLGCYGNTLVNTPTLDRLASQGMRFSQAFCQNPVCTPSRASFLTGRYPRTTRCRQNGQSIPADEVLVTKLLEQAGYTCGLSGKLHISACHPSVTPVRERRIDDGYAEFYWSHHPEEAGRRNSNWTTNEYNQWLSEQGASYQRQPFRGSSHVFTSMPAELHQTTWCASKAINFIETNAAYERPWLFSVNFFDPHHPFDPPPEYLERYLDRLEDIPLPNYVPGELDDKPVFQQIDHEGAYGGGAGFHYDGMSTEDHRLVRAAYLAMIELIDAQVGAMLEALERTGQLENTLVIFMSDHGEMLGDHGIYLKGPYFYEGAVHVPLIISWPTVIAPGQQYDELVELVDIAPTLLDAAGLPPYAGMQGRSLWPRLSGLQQLGRDNIYSECYNSAFRYSEISHGAHATMLRTARYKLVAVHGAAEGQARGELYDLVSDPRETRNLWHHPDYQSVRLELLEQLCDRMATTVDPLPLREAVW
jgi:arylsulfatase A-like enzyme